MGGTEAAQDLANSGPAHNKSILGGLSLVDGDPISEKNLD